MQMMLYNFLLYLIVIIFVLFRNKGKFHLGVLLFIWYSFIAFCGWYAVNSGIYTDIYRLIVPKGHVDAYIYVLVLFLILLYPLRKFDIKENINIYMSKRYVIPNSLFKCLILIFFFFGLMKLYEVYIISNQDLGSVYDDMHEEGKAAVTYSNFVLSKFSTYGGIIYQSMYPFVLFQLVIYTLRKSLPILNCLLLYVIVLIPQFLAAASTASRGGMVFGLFNVFFFLYLFKKYIPKKVLNLIVLSSSIVIAVILIVIVAITSDRVGGETEYIVNGFTLYLGEAFPNITCRYWDKVFCHPMGQRLFGLQEYGSLSNFFNYWDLKTHVTMATFKTLPIDVYIEFGKLGGFLFVLFLSKIFSNIVSKGISLWNVGLAFWYYQLCTMAIYSYCKRGDVNFKVLVLTIIFSFYFYMIKKKNFSYGTK